MRRRWVGLTAVVTALVTLEVTFLVLGAIAVIVVRHLLEVRAARRTETVASDRA